MELQLTIDDKKYNLIFRSKENSESSLEWSLVPLKDVSDLMFELTSSKGLFKLGEVDKRIKENRQEIEDQIDEYAQRKLEYEQMGIERETEGESGEVKGEVQPFDPEKIRVDPRNFSVHHVFEMMTKYESLDLSPDFQRNFVWTDITRKSRLIESILLRIPLPVFYLSETIQGTFHVVDGVQRLTVIKEFLENKFRLKNLEYLENCNGCWFDKTSNSAPEENLNPKFLGRIQQTQLSFNIISSDTPAKVKFEIFKRINTGGKPLNAQEIRNCLSESNTRQLLRDSVESKEFLEATNGGVNDRRMGAQELVLRFYAFYHLYNKDDSEILYSGEMDPFLNEFTEYLNRQTVEYLNSLWDAFQNAMWNAKWLFGQYAFRKIIPMDLEPHARKQLINKGLFTSWTVILSTIVHSDLKQKLPEHFMIEPIAEALYSDNEYFDAVSYSTNSNKNIKTARGKAIKLMEIHNKK